MVGIETTASVNLEAEDEIEDQVPMETVVGVQEHREEDHPPRARSRLRSVRKAGTDRPFVGAVRHTPVTGFVGQDAYNPVPCVWDEVFDMLPCRFEEQQS